MAFKQEYISILDNDVTSQVFGVDIWSPPYILS